MPKLNQIVAVEKGARSTVENAVTTAYHTAQRGDLFNGQIRVYEPKDEEGDKLPDETQRMIATVDGVVEAFIIAQTQLFDVTATKVYANTEAKADVVVDGQTIMADVPVEYLLFMEKRLIDVMTFISKLPTLDPSAEWHFDEAAGTYKSAPVKTTRSKKVMRNHIKAAATDKHPAQVDVFTEDVIVGTWSTTKLSSAVPATKVAEWKTRVLALQQAVQFAREEANSVEVTNQRVGTEVFNYIFT